MATRRKSPTAKKRLLALTLRELAERAGLKPQDISTHVSHDSTWVTKVLNGVLTPHPNDVYVMLGLFDIDPTGPQGQAILGVSKLANQRGGWWQSHVKFMPEWFSKYVGLESEANYLRIFDCQVVPGLFQTEAYARATLHSDPLPGTVERIEKQVELRIMRQDLLDLDDPPQIRAVLDEGILRRPVGGPLVMRDQIEHLLKLTERPNIQVQILPFSAGAHSGFGGPFIILAFPPMPDPYPEVADPNIVYVDLLTGAHYFEEPHEIAAYTAAWDGLTGEALGAQESRIAMRTMAQELDT